MKWPGWSAIWKRLGERRAALFIALGALLADQATKIAVELTIPARHGITVIPDFFTLVHHHNTGMTWGFLSDVDGLRWLLAGIKLLASLMILLWLALEKRLSKVMLWGLGLVLGGALGNLVDRVRIGAVIDFLRFNFGEFVWPSFNIADAALVIGVALVLISTLFGGRGREEKDRLQDRQA